MRDWTLAPGDPLSLTLAADARFSEPDYLNDHIWELELGGGDPSALALRTTYGLRARSMRIFPRFLVNRKAYANPVDFHAPPRILRFAPNFILLEFSPFSGLDVTAEYWVPDSHSVAGRITVSNHGGESLSLLLEMCGLLVPFEGNSLSPVMMQSVNILAGRTANLSPVIFLTGSPQAGPGPYPSLTLDLALPSGGDRSLTWVQAALGDPAESFDLARRIAARPWDAERTKIWMVNTADTVDIRTGDPDWDAAFAFTQKAALGLFLGASQFLPSPSFVLARQPDHGYTPGDKGQDQPLSWKGASPLEAYYISSLLPGAPSLSKGLLQNYQAVQLPSGEVDSRPGVAGQRSHWLAAPLLSALAWKVFSRDGDTRRLQEIFPRLLAFHQLWFTLEHDQDKDGFPEWSHPIQAGLDDHPAFNIWHVWDQGALISAVESPALAAFLCRDALLLSRMADRIGQEGTSESLQLEAGRLRGAAEDCWQAGSALYHYRDRDTHLSLSGKMIVRQPGDGKCALEAEFNQPTRLLIQIRFKGKASLGPKITIKGKQGHRSHTEHLERSSFMWGTGMAATVTSQAYTALTGLEVRGLGKSARVILKTMDLAMEDASLFLPLWAGIPNEPRARALVNRTLFDADRFGRPYGIPMYLPTSREEAETVVQAVDMPWNHLIGEGLLEYGMRAEAALLTSRLMSAVVDNLKRQRTFAHGYHAETGLGIGERNDLHGFAPLGLFLQTLGIEIRSPGVVLLSGKNPFPWPVTVQYRGLTVTRQAEQTQVTFPDGREVILTDPSDGIVSAE